MLHLKSNITPQLPPSGVHSEARPAEAQTPPEGPDLWKHLHRPHAPRQVDGSRRLGRTQDHRYSPIRLMDHRIMVQFGYWFRF